MSLDIDQIALHQLIKRDEQNLELVLRESLLEPNATVVEMMAELHRVYSAKSKAYGLFNEESELAQALRLQRQGEEEFLAFSRAATGRLRDELAKQYSEDSVDSDPSLAAEALMKLVASNNPPLRLILGSMVYDLAMDTLKARMATWEEWEAVSRASEKAIPAPERYGV